MGNAGGGGIVNSINTNAGARTALQILAAQNRTLAESQSRLATGLKVASAKDDGAAWSMANASRSRALSYDTVGEARRRALSLLDVTLSATQSASDVVDRMKVLALAANDPSITDAERRALDADFQSLKSQVDNVAREANFNGLNLLDSTGSNFLKYGPSALPAGERAIDWGVDDRTTTEPVAGETLDLKFGFAGAGQQFERVEGVVDYKLRYWDNGWTEVALAQHDIDPPATLTPGGAPYVADATATMPSIPASATAVEIYAEFTGKYPSPDGETITDLMVNGAPATSILSEGVPHLLARWGERDWKTASRTPAQSLGFSAAGSSSVLTAPSEAGAVINGSIDLSPAARGINEAGFSYSVSYQVQDISSGTWVNLATSPVQTVPYGPVSPAGQTLPYSLTIPTPTPGHYDFSNARLVANVTTEHTGAVTVGPLPDSVAGDSTVKVPSASFSPPQWPVLQALSTGAVLTHGLTAGSDVAAETFDAEVAYVMRWHDGATWQEQTIEEDARTGLASGALADFGRALRLPNVPDPVTQLEVVARVKVVHDPEGAANTDAHDLTLLSWDSADPAQAHSGAFVMATNNNAAQVFGGMRQVETVVKIEVLDGISGGSTPIREINTRTSGTAGLNLQDASLIADPSAALDYVEYARRRLRSQTQYFAQRSNTLERSLAFEIELADVIRTSVGNLVDADLGKESARLEAVQSRQSLAAQALSIANSMPSMILALFRR